MNTIFTDSAPPARSLSGLLQDLHDGLPATETVSMALLLEALHERGFGMLLLLFATPMALPVPVPPGINIMLASPLVILTAQQMMGAHTIWLPQKMKAKTFSVVKLRGMINDVIPWLRKIEKIIKPRLSTLTHGNASRFFGFLGLLMALTVMIPVPMTNTIPSFGIAVMAIGTLSRDGLATLVGAIVGMGWLTVLACGVIFLGPHAIDIIHDAIKSLLS